MMYRGSDPRYILNAFTIHCPQHNTPDFGMFDLPKKEITWPVEFYGLNLHIFGEGVIYCARHTAVIAVLYFVFKAVIADFPVCFTALDGNSVSAQPDT